MAVVTALSNDVWPKLERAFAPALALWGPDECKNEPGSTEKLIAYLITYTENTGVARNAIRLFCGIEGDRFLSLNEVRVSSVREIEDALKEAGAKADTWELALTIKDFLQNAWDFLSTLDLDEAKEDCKPADLANYLKQLSGEQWKKNETSPYRPVNGIYDRKKGRKQGEPVLPECAIEFLNFLWKRTSNPPYEFYTDRVLSRIGIIANDDSLGDKYQKFLGLIEQTQPIKRHRLLVTLGKLICTTTPRCGVCPVAEHCATRQAQQQPALAG